MSTTTTGNFFRIGSTKFIESPSDVKIDVTEISRPRVNIRLREVNLLVKKSKLSTECKSILQDISDIEIKSGRLFAIMGGSGSGKTSLLNLIGGRIVNVKLEGQILFNEQEPSSADLKSLVGYVTQNDYLLPSLTVRETLRYAAMMRLPSSVSKCEQNQRVEDVIQELGLKDCSNSRIGDEAVRGISGGERRRVSIGIQLLTDPSILLLDEPTSGLDSFTANNLMKSLSKIAKRNRTVILSIHQPRSDIYGLIDDILLLTKGNVVYCGPRDDVMGYFTSIGFQCPSHTNPADFFLDITSIDVRDAKAEEVSRQQVQLMIDAYKRWHKLHNPNSKSKLLSSSESVFVQTSDNERTMAPFSRAFPLLVRRAFTNVVRSSSMTTARLTQVTGFGFVLMLFYTRLGYDFFSIQNRIGLLYEAITPLLFVGMLNCIAVCMFNVVVSVALTVTIVPTERNVFYRERADGAYSSWAFLASYMANEIPFELVTCLIYTTFVVPSIGLQTTPYHYFSLFFIFWCLVFTGESLGIIFCGIFYTVGFSVTVASVILSAFCGMTGLMSINMPDVFQSKIFSLIPSVATINEFTGLTFTCSVSQQLADGSCPFTTGQQVLDTYKIDPDQKWLNFGLIIILTIVYRIFAFLVFRVVKKQFSQ